MKPKILAIVAGLPWDVGQIYLQKSLRKNFNVISWKPLKWTESYTEDYSQSLYFSFIEKLKNRTKEQKYEEMFRTMNLIVIFVEKDDGNVSNLYDVFGMEGLLLPIKIKSDSMDRRRKTKSQREQIANHLIEESERAVSWARGVLSYVSEEITSRENKTSLLLPLKNFGPSITKVIDCLQGSFGKRWDVDEVRRRVERASGEIQKTKENGKAYPVGRKGLVFRAPGKAVSRHGLAPGWGQGGHMPSCVVRGRMRFGAWYDPRFHFDCDIKGRGVRTFPSCHGNRTLPRGRRHVNISPNDNIR